MPTRRTFDVAVVGGGIVGLATARALLERQRLSLVVLEAEERLATHQSGRNSGVLHSGLYYKPGSLKAKLCTRGREALVTYCEERGLPFSRCGKLVVATRESEIPALEELERRGAANGLDGIERLDSEGIRAREPWARGLTGLWVPQTGTVDFSRVAAAYAEDVVRHGGEILTGARLVEARTTESSLELRTTHGPVSCGRLINCAGLYCDRVAGLCGVQPEVRILPMRGEYLELVGESRDRVRGLIYPVPDPALPFLGVHLTRTLDGRVLAGPNAVPALAREGYRRGQISLRDVAGMLTWPGTWRLVFGSPPSPSDVDRSSQGRAGSSPAPTTTIRPARQRLWRIAWGELARAASRRRFLEGVQALLPTARLEDLRPAPSGVRAQAVDRAGRLVDDFRIERGERSLHVLNAPSPAATASLAIGEHLAAELLALDD
jgi:(S)-2-hydroxyglutarate dehydrogenase